MSRIHDETVRYINTESIQLDEVWARVGVRQSRTTELDAKRGDFYTFLALDRRTKLIISHLTGKRDYVNTDYFVAVLASCVSGAVQITCDGWRPYVQTIPQSFAWPSQSRRDAKDLWQERGQR